MCWTCLSHTQAHDHPRGISDRLVERHCAGEYGHRFQLGIRDFLARGEALPKSERWSGQVAYWRLDQFLEDLKDPFGDEL